MYSPDTPEICCFLYSMNEKFNYNAKDERLTKLLGSGDRHIIINPFPFAQLQNFSKYVAH